MNMETLVRKQAFKKVRIREGGRVKEVCAIEAMMMQLMASAMKGDKSSTALMIKLFDQFGKDIPGHENGSAEPFSNEGDRKLIEELLRIKRDFAEDDTE